MNLVEPSGGFFLHTSGSHTWVPSGRTVSSDMEAILVGWRRDWIFHNWSLES